MNASKHSSARQHLSSEATETLIQNKRLRNQNKLLTDLLNNMNRHFDGSKNRLMPLQVGSPLYNPLLEQVCSDVCSNACTNLL